MQLLRHINCCAMAGRLTFLSVLRARELPKMQQAIGRVAGKNCSVLIPVLGQCFSGEV